VVQGPWRTKKRHIVFEPEDNGQEIHKLRCPERQGMAGRVTSPVGGRSCEGGFEAFEAEVRSIRRDLKAAQWLDVPAGRNRSLRQALREQRERIQGVGFNSPSRASLIEKPLSILGWVLDAPPQ